MSSYFYFLTVFAIILLSSTTPMSVKGFQLRQCSGGDCPVIFPDPDLIPICFWAVDIVLDPSSSSSSPLSIVQKTYNDSTMSLSTQVSAESQINLNNFPFESDIQVNISSPTCSVIGVDLSAKEKNTPTSSFRSIANLTWLGLADLKPSTEAGILCEVEKSNEGESCQIELETSVLNGSPVKIKTNSIVQSGDYFYVAYNHTEFKACGGWILISNIKLTCSATSSSESTTATSSESSTSPRQPKAFCQFVFGKECNSQVVTPAASDSESSYELPPLPETTVLPTAESASESVAPVPSPSNSASVAPASPSSSVSVVPASSSSSVSSYSSVSRSAVALQSSSKPSYIPSGGLFSGIPLPKADIVSSSPNPTSGTLSASSSPSSAPVRPSVQSQILFASSGAGISSWVSILNNW